MSAVEPAVLEDPPSVVGAAPPLTEVAPAETVADETQTFEAVGSRAGGARHRWIRSPLGVYTTPLVLLVLWQAASWRGWLSPTVSASPIEVARAAVHLWQVGAPSTLGRICGSP